MELTKEEKLAIITDHYKRSITNSYDIQVNLIQEQALPTPNQDVIAALNNNLVIEEAKRKALDDQIISLQN